MHLYIPVLGELSCLKLQDYTVAIPKKRYCAHIDQHAPFQLTAKQVVIHIQSSKDILRPFTQVLGFPLI